MRNYHFTVLILICFCCCVAGCSESPEEVKRKEVIYWLKSWPTSSRFKGDNHTSWYPSWKEKDDYHTSWYPSWEEWEEAWHKIEGIEQTLIGFLENDIDITEVHGDRICRALGYFGSDDSVPVLMDVLADGKRDEATRKVAAEALGRIGNPAAVELLCQIVHTESDLLLKDFAITALGTFGDPNAIPVIEEELRNLQFKQSVFEEILKELKDK